MPIQSTKNYFCCICQHNGIFASPNTVDVDQAINDLRNSNCDIEDQRLLSEHLGVYMKQDSKGVLLSQPHLIDQIIKDVGLENNKTANKLIPSPSTVLLSVNTHGKPYT